MTLDEENGDVTQTVFSEVDPNARFDANDAPDFSSTPPPRPAAEPSVRVPRASRCLARALGRDGRVLPLGRGHERHYAFFMPRTRRRDRAALTRVHTPTCPADVLLIGGAEPDLLARASEAWPRRSTTAGDRQRERASTRRAAEIFDLYFPHRYGSTATPERICRAALGRRPGLAARSFVGALGGIEGPFVRGSRQGPVADVPRCGRLNASGSGATCSFETACSSATTRSTLWCWFAATRPRSMPGAGHVLASIDRALTAVHPTRRP